MKEDSQAHTALVIVIKVRKFPMTTTTSMNHKMIGIDIKTVLLILKYGDIKEKQRRAVSASHVLQSNLMTSLSIVISHFNVTMITQTYFNWFLFLGEIKIQFI